MSFAYRCLSYLTLWFLFPLLVIHPKLRAGLKLRLGLYPGRRPWPPSRGTGPRLWFHGASAGDLLALLPILQHVRSASPEATLIVSTMTNSGKAIADSKLRDLVDAVTYVPYDFPGATRRAAAAIAPDLLVLEYAEVWPNLISAVRAAGARVVLTNGRISERLLGRYRFFYRCFGNPLTRIDLLLMREEVEAERALSLGARPGTVRVTGNTKFDNVARDPDPAVVATLSAQLNAGGEPLFVAGSTHEGEERAIATILPRLRAVEPKLRLVIAPRYIERTPKIAAALRALGLEVELLSELAGAQARGDVVIIDRIGLLLAAYRLATLVFVGGSFVRRGGQNILEPASQGRAVFFGPYMMNFRDSVEVLLGRGGIQVANVDRLADVAAELLARPEERERLGAMAAVQVRRFAGAAIQNAQLLLELEASPRPPAPT